MATLGRVASSPTVIRPQGGETPGTTATGSSLVIGDWPASGLTSEVAPLHVHHVDDEAWHVISGALRFRFEDQVIIADAGSTVLVPAGVPHTFGNAGPSPSRFIIIVPAKLDELIRQLHETESTQHEAIYRRYDSELLE